jgi:hypothetical protein
VDHQLSSLRGAKSYKIAFDLEKESQSWPPVAVERLWAERTDVRFRFRVANIPFFVRGIACCDLVVALPDDDRREFVFSELGSESGHSALRIVIMDPLAQGDVEAKLRNAGCSWETATQFKSLIAVDVPSEVEYSALRKWFIERTDSGVLELQESAISSIHRSQVPDFPSR